MKTIIFYAALMFLSACSSTQKENTQTKQKEMETPNQSIESPMHDALPANHKVEIKISDKSKEGKTIVFTLGSVMKTDNCNSHGMSGEVTEDSQGHYILLTNGMVRATRMACPDNTQIEKFVRCAQLEKEFITGKKYLFMVPEGFTVEYEFK